MALIAIPLTVYLAQQQQQTQSHANPNTTLSFSPATATKAVGDTVNFDVMLSPGNNQVDFIKLAIKFDPTKLEADEHSFVVDPASNLTVVQQPVVENDTLTVTLTIGSDSTKVIHTPTKIGSVAFTTLAASDAPTQVSFDPTGIQIRSLNADNNDTFSENVFLNGAPASVTIQGESTPTPTVSPTAEVSAEPTAEATETPTPEATTEPTQTTVTGAPTCTSMLADSSVGTAPFTVNFTVTGSDIGGSINKVTFNYGDGNTEDITTGGGIGTDTLNLAQSHTYDSSGSFSATAVLTDDSQNASDSTSCTQAITVSAGGTATDSAAVTPLPATGPSTKIVGLGAIGGLLFMIGALLFLAL